MKTVDRVEIYVYILYIFLCISNQMYSTFFGSWFWFPSVPLFVFIAHFFVHCFPRVSLRERRQVLSTLDMKNMKGDPGIIVGFLAHGRRKFGGGISGWASCLGVRGSAYYQGIFSGIFGWGTTPFFEGVHRSGGWQRCLETQRQKQNKRWKPMDRACW